MLAEEAEELGTGVRPARICVGPVRGPTGPAMPATVDDPALGQASPGAVLVARTGESLATRYLPAAGHHGRRRGGPAVTQAHRQGVVDEVRDVGVGHGRVLITMENDQRPG